MDSLVDIAEFTAASLAPRLPESCQVNPEVYGAELAYWLSAELAHRGIVTSYPEREDWGWYLDFASPAGSSFAVHCGNVGGAKDRWFLQLRRFGRKRFGRDKPPFREAETLVETLRALLEESPEIRYLDWRYADVQPNDGGPA